MNVVKIKSTYRGPGRYHRYEQEASALFKFLVAALDGWYSSISVVGAGWGVWQYENEINSITTSVYLHRAFSTFSTFIRPVFVACGIAGGSDAL